MLEKAYELVKRNHNIPEENPYYKSSERYIKELLGEINEVKEELKENNSVYLEDELCDVMYDYLNLLLSLEKEGKITSTSKVFERFEHKYEERISAIEDENTKEAWDKVKKRQKENLRAEHQNLYGNE